MSIERAVYCVVCGAPPEYAISTERDGVIAHWGSCHDHLMVTAARVMGGRDEVEYARLRRQGEVDRSRAMAVEVDETTVLEIEGA